MRRNARNGHLSHPTAGAPLGWAVAGAAAHARGMPPVAQLADSVLDLPIDGVRLDASTLRELTGDGPVLLVFLRHFG